MERDYITIAGLRFRLRGAESLPSHKPFKDSDELFSFLVNVVNRHFADFRSYEQTEYGEEPALQLHYSKAFDFISCLKAELYNGSNPKQHAFKISKNEAKVILKIPYYKAKIEIGFFESKCNGESFKYLSHTEAAKIIKKIKDWI